MSKVFKVSKKKLYFCHDQKNTRFLIIYNLHLEEEKCQDFQGLKKQKNTCLIVTDCYLVNFTPIFMSPLTFFTILTCKRHNFIVFKIYP